MSNNDVWVKVLKRLQPTIMKAHFITWLQNTTIVERSESKVVVGVPTAFAQTWVEGKYKLKIKQALQEIDPSIEEVSYAVHARLAEKENKEGADIKKIFDAELNKKVRKVRNKNEVRVGVKGSMVDSRMLNNRYWLHNFVVGADNQLPHAAAQAVVRMPGGRYNPLFMYGGVGLGKTHLLQAIGNEILKDNPDAVIKYITAERFVSEVVAAIQGRKMKQFKERYRSVDCLLLDDVQFFVRKESSQKELFHTFDELYNNNKQIVITSDRAPAQLAGIDDRLRSRFGMGMVVELQMADFETRLAILKQKCAEEMVLIDPKVLEFVATNVTTSIRELEGVLRQIVMETQLKNSSPTIRNAAAILKRVDSSREIIGLDDDLASRNFARTANDVMRTVASYFGLSLEDLCGPVRRREVMLPRQICMYLIKNELGESYEKIGMNFGGRNHTTVMHACNKMGEVLKNDVKILRDLNAIKGEMGL